MISRFSSIARPPVTCSARLRAVLLAAVLAIAVVSRASTDPGTAPPEIQTVRAAKSGNGVQLTWSDGAGPFSLGRDPAPDFSNLAGLLLVPGIGAPNYFDAGVLLDANSCFYLLSDAQSPPRVFDAGPARPAPGDTITIRGMGLTGAAAYDASDASLALATNTDTTITLSVPGGAGMTAGPITIGTNYGSAVTDPIPVTIHKVGINGLGTPGHVAWDPLNAQVLYANFENTTARLFKYTPVNGQNAVFGTVWAKFINGLAIGPFNGTGRYLYTTSNTKPLGTNNPGTIFAYDLVTGIRSSAGPQTTNSTADSVDTRALAIGPDPYGAAGYTVHSLTMASTLRGSLVRFLKLDNTLPPPADWLSIGATGDTINQNWPGGLLVNSSRSYYFTTGGAVGTVEFWKSLAGRPLARVHELVRAIHQQSRAACA